MKFRSNCRKYILDRNCGTIRFQVMNLENQSSKSGEHKTEELEKQVENLKKIIELQQKTQEHDRNLQLKHFKYEMM